MPEEKVFLGRIERRKNGRRMKRESVGGWGWGWGQILRLRYMQL